jgi:hypothetical protein
MGLGAIMPLPALENRRRRADDADAADANFRLLFREISIGHSNLLSCAVLRGANAATISKQERGSGMTVLSAGNIGSHMVHALLDASCPILCARIPMR